MTIGPSDLEIFTRIWKQPTKDKMPIVTEISRALG